MTQETGPVYGVPLIDTLPFGSNGFVQAMPSREDLRLCRVHDGRVAAGYEVLLHHYQKVCEERDKYKAAHELLTQSVANYCEREVEREPFKKR